jgi:hypothetical protein
LEKGNKLDTAASVNKLRRWSFGALLIASDEVVLAHDRFLNASRISGEMGVPAIAHVIIAMRRDVGPAQSNIQLIDVLNSRPPGGIATGRI